MLKRKFDPNQPYQVVVYLRMSSDRQNPRSPDQQLAQIKSTIKRRGLPWRIVKVYRDEGISGRYKRKRRQFQAMLRDLKSGAVAADLVLCDTIERFGRTDDLTATRNELFRNHGVLVLAADTEFTDPTSEEGHLLSVFHDLRATSDGRKKAHDVLRGKRDAIFQDKWPGGNPPFGMKLETVFKSVGGRQEVDYCKVVPDPATAWVICEVFAKADESGWGGTRIARRLNDRDDLPEGLQPVAASTVSYWLNQTLYKGELTWARKATDIVNDVRVSEANPEDEVVRVPGFCEAIVAPRVWDRVAAVRAARSARILAGREKNRSAGAKRLKPRGAGLTLKYLLSGLVRCDHCGRAMVPRSSPEYTTTKGERRHYVMSVCPANSDGSCPNDRHVPEAWLRKTVVDLIKERLLPTTTV